MSLICGILLSARRAGGWQQFGAWSALVVVLAGQSIATAQQATHLPSQEQPLVEFNVEKDGGPLIVPVAVDVARGKGKAAPKMQCRMLIDTGATHTVFHSSRSAMLGTVTGKKSAKVLAGTTNVETFQPPVIYIGPVAVHPAYSSIACMDLTSVRNLCGEPIDGLLGMDVLGQLVFSVDFDEGKLRLHRHVDPYFGRPVALSWADGVPAVRAAFDRTTAGKSDLFKLDTGGIDTFSGYVSEARYRELLRDKAVVPGTPTYVFRGFAADRMFDAALFRAAGLSLGPYSHKNLVFLHLSSEANCLGLAYLSRYFLTFDFPDSKMYLRPGRAFYRPDSYDLSALKVLRQEGEIIVTAALEGGAAAAAGFRERDVIVGVNGRSTREMTLFAFRRVLKTQGRHVFRARRGSHEFDIALELKSQDTSFASSPASAPARR